MSRFLNTFGKRMKALREERSRTQEELVELLRDRLAIEITQGYLSKLESSSSAKWPGSELVAGVARILQTSTDYLLLLTDDPRPLSQRWSEVGEADGIQMRLLELVRELSPADQLQVLGLARTLRQQVAATPEPAAADGDMSNKERWAALTAIAREMGLDHVVDEVAARFGITSDVETPAPVSSLRR